jgi:hypothetical protein
MTRSTSQNTDEWGCARPEAWISHVVFLLMVMAARPRNVSAAHRAATATVCSAARALMTWSHCRCRARASPGLRPSWAAVVSWRLMGALTLR